MITVEVPRSDWARTLAAFTDIHDGWLVSVEALDSAIGAQPLISNLPLLEVSLESDGDDATIVMSAGSSRANADHVTHLVRRVQRVYIERTEDGADVALGVESSDKAKTILRFRTVMRPEAVDGIVRP